MLSLQKELENWKPFKLYSVVCDEGQLWITTTWVITEKLIENAKTIKARLAARGFQVEQDLVVEPPTAHKSTMRIAFTIAAMKSSKIKKQPTKSQLTARPKYWTRFIFSISKRELWQE